MGMDILEKFKPLWSHWGVRVLILFSLSFQIILLFLGRLRKTSTSVLIQKFLWIFYILADLLAVFVLTQQAMNDSSHSNKAIYAFWAPFLILHLGGPDTITAYSIEDNELWDRHLLRLIYALLIAIYVFFCSLPNTLLLAPTILIFLVAIIKCGERSYSLYKASAKRFYSSSLLSFEKSLSCAPSTFTYLGTDMLNVFDGVLELYYASKPYFIDVTPVSAVHEKIIHFINKLTTKSSIPAKESFEVVLTVTFMELSYVYDELYTKAIVNHSRVGYVLRAFCTICILVALSLFVLAPKISIDEVDVVITYVLLAASVFLDAIAAIMLFFSDWMMLKFPFQLCNWSRLLTEQIGRNKTEMLKRRYALETPQLNIIKNWVEIIEDECPLQRMVNWIKRNLSFLEERELYPNSNFITKGYTLYTMKPVNLTLELLEIIATNAKSCIEISFRNLDEPSRFFALHEVKSTPSWVVPSIVELIKGFPFDEQVLIWHLSTDLCFHWKSESLHPIHSHDHADGLGVGQENSSEMKVCEYLSNYMIYLVLMRPHEMFTMERRSPRMFYIVFQDLIKLIHTERVDSVFNPTIENVCRDMLTPIDRRWVIHLKVMVMLAYLILLLKGEERWKVVTKAWVELLILGAENTKANMHMKQLSKGVDLLTFIWLLSKYFGIEYPKKAQHAYFRYVSPEDCEESFILEKRSCIEKLSTRIKSH